LIDGAGSRREFAGVDSRNMHSDSSDLNLLMVHADDHAPVLAEGLPGDAAGEQDVAADDSAPEHFWDEGGDPNDLELQRWGVIAPQGPVGDRLLALIKPLIARREQQQGDAVRIYRVPPQLTADEAMRWKKREFDSGADLNIEVPRYQLILGDLDQVPLALQQVQASDGYVGRLAFTAEDDYAAYVDKLLRWESLSEGPGDSDALFFTVHDGTAATAVGHRALVAPGVEVVKKRKASGQYPAREIVEFGDRMTPAPDELLRRVAGGAPNVLFTLSHGEGAPRGGWKSPEEQRRRQGAMSFGREGKLMGDDLRARPFLPGGIWFMLACYGAGTPGHSAYKHWLEALASAGQFRGKPESVLAGLAGPDTRPFIAALPQAVLANANGPLAFMGHVDLAWTYGFQDLDSGATNRPARYMAITRSLLKRDRVGVSMRELLRFFDQTNVELTSLHDQEARARSMGQPVQPDVARQSHLWMLRNDLAAYVLLGDPAVKLPPGGDPPAARPAPRERHIVTSAPTPAPKPAEPAPATSAAPPAEPAPAPNPAAAATAPNSAAVRSDAPAPALEEALARWLLADLEIDAAAARAGIPRAELERLGALYRQHGRGALRRT
jgi:hypothetical protein